MLVDVVLYGGEVELLKARLDHMQADLTILVEGDTHFTGQRKGWSFLNDDVSKFIPKHMNRLKYVPVVSSHNSNAWANEKHQRDSVTDVLYGLDIPDDSVVGFFDVDEFPVPDIMRKRDGVHAWFMRKYQMSLFWFEFEELTGVSGVWGELKKKTFGEWRHARGQVPRIEDGFHFSSFGSQKEVVRKWKGFSHTEFQRPDMEDWVAEAWVEGKALQSGAMLQEQESLNPGFPDYMLRRRGPEHWYRKRPIS